jgi:hypothetical protein
MTITLSPEQEQAIRHAILAGQVASVEEFIQRAVAELPKLMESSGRNSASVFEQGLGLFGSPEDAALLDDVVNMAYEERRRPSKRNVAL